MNQIERLKSIRQEAWERLEEARNAIEQSPDGKLVATLELMIAEMEQAQTAVAELPKTIEDLSLDDLITELETPIEEIEAEPAATEENGLEVSVGVDAYLAQ